MNFILNVGFLFLFLLKFDADVVDNNNNNAGPSGQPLGSLNGSMGPAGLGGPHNNNNTNNHNNNNMGTTTGAGPSHPHTPSPNNHPSGGGGGIPPPQQQQQHSSTSSVSPKTFHFEGLLTGTFSYLFVELLIRSFDFNFF